MNKYELRQFIYKYLKERIFQIYNFFGRYITDIVEGNKITYDPNTEIGRNLFFYGEFEKAELEICRKYITKDSVVLDVGANIGIHSLFYSKCASEGFVISIEPSQETFALLLHNLKVADNVIPLNLAAYNNTIINEFYVASDNAYSSIIDTHRKNIIKRQKVICCKLDDLFSNCFNRIDFIKIDVEGVEQKVIEGLETIIENYKPVVSCEIYQGTNSNNYPADTVEYMIGKGYEAFVLKNGCLTKYLTHNDNFYNYIFTPNHET